MFELLKNQLIIHTFPVQIWEILVLAQGYMFNIVVVHTLIL